MPLATALTGSRVDTWLTHLQIDSVFMGAWDTASGFEVDSEETKYRPGGMADEEVSLGGRVTYSNITVTRIFTEWLAGMHAWMITRVGKARVYIVRYPLTADYVQLARATGAQGTLKRVALPDYDSMGSDAGVVEVEATIDRYWS
jgi:hypothetical protein